MHPEPARDDNSFFITLPEGWSLVDFRRLLDETLIDLVKSALGDALTPADATRLHDWFSALRQEFDTESMGIMALRIGGEGDVLEVLTVACPTLTQGTGADEHEAQTQPTESRAEITQLSNGAQAMIHHSDVKDDIDHQGWTSVKLVMPIPQTQMPVILTLASTDSQAVDALTTEASILAGSISTSTAKPPVADITLS
jgi:hypothetical protein